MIGFILPRCIKPSVRSLKHTINVVRCYSQKQPSSRLLSPLTSCAELHEQMQRADWHTNIRVLDARWDLDDGDYLAMHQNHRIGGSKFFSFEECRDVTALFPRMLPNEAEFANYVTNLGVSNEHHVVVYDDHEKHGLYSSPRVWWMFRVFGHENVSVLDGGFRKWCLDGYPTISGEYVEDEILPEPTKSYVAKFHPRMVKDFEIVRKNAVSLNPVQLVDARGTKRFDDAHIPQSISAPFAEIFDANRTVRSNEELVDLFKSKGVNLNEDVITSCGSGITASVVALALYKAVRAEVAVFDGSFTEWNVRAPHLISKRVQATGPS